MYIRVIKGGRNTAKLIKGVIAMEYRIKRNKKQYEVYVDDKLNKSFISLELALDYIKWLKVVN